jgi:uncharacterized protein (TIGR02266 family)
MLDDRRIARRARVSGVRVTIENATGQRLEAQAFDLSRGGLFVRTDGRVAIGKRISLEIQVDGQPSVWPALGRVVWVRSSADGPDRPAGLGVTLIDVDDAVSQAIDRLVESAERFDRASGGRSAGHARTIFGMGALPATHVPVRPSVPIVASDVAGGPPPEEPSTPHPTVVQSRAGMAETAEASLTIDLVARRPDPVPVSEREEYDRAPADDEPIVIPKRRGAAIVVWLLLVAAVAAGGYACRDWLPIAWTAATSIVHRLVVH